MNMEIETVAAAERQQTCFEAFFRFLVTNVFRIF